MRVVSGRAYFGGALQSVDIGIEDGKIAVIRKSLRGGEKRYDFGDAILLPGGVDLHVHFREPGLTDKDDFASGTRSAAIGGVTAVLEMPNTIPPVTDRVSFEQKLALARRSANVDFALAIAPLDATALAKNPRAPAAKVYMAESTGGLVVPDPRVLGEILEAAAGAGTLVSVHCEDPSEFRPGPARDLAGHDAARPATSEVSAVKALLSLRGRARVHIAHATLAEVLHMRPDGVTAEVTPHHLLLDTSSRLGAQGKVNPPLRTAADREALWKAVFAGKADAFASDHAPHTLEEKSLPFDEAPSGVPGVATTLPLLMRHVRRGTFSLDRFVAMFSANPARILGANKGEIAVGRDADLVAVDPRRVVRITAKRCGYKCGWTPFEGHEGVFPIATFVRGRLVARDGELAEERVGEPITVPESS